MNINYFRFTGKKDYSGNSSNPNTNHQLDLQKHSN